MMGDLYFLQREPEQGLQEKHACANQLYGQ
jgi:hypothetical protein